MTRLVRFSNNAVSKLASAITSTSTTITLQTGDGSKFPALTGTQYFKATLVKADGTTEVVKVTARSGDTLTVVRAAEAVAGVQTAYAFSSGDRIEHRLTAGDVANELDRLDAAAYISPLNKSANYTVTAADITSLIRVNTGSGNVTITLPEISTLTEDFDVIVAKVTADTNVVTVQRAGTTDTINGATTYSLTGQWQGAWLTADRSTGTWTVIASGGSGVKANVDTFTGSGTAGPFTLSGDPGVKENTAVYVGGVYQQKSTYTLVGTSLTLGGTVATGVSVEVIWSQPLQIGITTANQTTASDGASGSLFTTVQGFITWLLGGNLSSSLLKFIQAGTGAVQRTAQDKAREFVSITDFGASTSASGAVNIAAIQAAIDAVNAAGGGTVFVPSGTFLLDVVNYLRDDGTTVYGITSFKMKDNVHLTGVGATSVLKVKNGAYGAGAFFRIISSRDATRLSNAKISNLTIDGNRANQAASTQCSNIVLECLAKVEVEGVRSINANGNGIMLRGTTSSYASNIGIRNNIVENCSSIGIQSSQFYGLVISGNVVNGTSDNCIDIYGEDGTTTCHGMNFSITGNVCQSGLVGVFCETVRNGVVSGNDIIACTLGVTVNRINGQPHAINITGNTTYSCQYGVRVTGDTGGISINGNHFQGFSVAGVQLGESGGRCSYVDVSQNFFTPASNTVAIIATGGNQVSFVTGKFNAVNSSGITPSYLFYNAATTKIGIVVDSFRVIPNQVGKDLVAADAQITKLTLLNGAVDNTAGPVDIALDDSSGGLLYVTGVQGGVGTSTWIVPFTKRGGALVLGTAQKAIITADPISSIAVSSGSARINCLAANTYLRYAIQYVPTL